MLLTDPGDTHELLSKLTTEQIDSAKDDMRPGDLRKLKRLQELVLSHHGIDEDEVKQELGPEWAEWFDDPLAYSKKTEKELQAEDSSEAESEVPESSNPWFIVTIEGCAVTASAPAIRRMRVRSRPES